MRSYGQLCAVARALDIVGDRWALLVVRELLISGPLRFTDLQRGLPGVAPNLLAQRLRELEGHGVVHRVPATPPATGTLYASTDRGPNWTASYASSCGGVPPPSPPPRPGRRSRCTG